MIDHVKYGKRPVIVVLFFISLSLLITSALASLLVKKWGRHFGCGGVFLGSAVGVAFSINALIRNVAESWHFGVPLPGLNLTFGVDALSAFFLVPIFGLSLLVSLYAWGYLKNQPLLLSSLPFFPLLVASMAAVVTARDGFLFVICWEVMSLASFFLVVAEHELREVRHAGWVYLVATHLATAFLIALFVLLSEKAGSFRFEDWSHVAPLPPLFAGTLFFFALIGFGTKAGIFPLHVWLPHAHPAAPSFISALMSGVMIKTGIYGLLRALTFLGPTPLWWGMTLMGFGLLSALLGILYASVQGDLKKMLAFSSVENIGIIFVGIGAGLIGLNRGDSLLFFLCFGGALFHIWNHSVFKGLLFLGAGSVLRATHTRLIDQLGGLAKKMPVPAGVFLVASAAVCGLPPLNGFISEFLIYYGLLHGVDILRGVPLFLAVIGIVGIAFAGGLALACFGKVFGIVFLGESRSTRTDMTFEMPIAMQFPLIMLCLLCLLGGIFPQVIWPAIVNTLEVVSFSPAIDFGDGRDVMSLFTPFVQTFLLLLGTGLLISLLGWLLYRSRRVRRAVTWDCGYASPTPRMQYTASSFTQPTAVFFRALLRPDVEFKKPDGIFPKGSNFVVHIADLAEKNLWWPFFHHVDRLFELIRKIQKGRIQNALALIFFTLIALLLWEVWFGI